MLLVGGVANDPLKGPVFGASDGATPGLDVCHQVIGTALQLVGQALDVVRAGQRIDGVRDPGLVGDDLHGPQ